MLLACTCQINKRSGNLFFCRVISRKSFTYLPSSVGTYVNFGSEAGAFSFVMHPALALKRTLSRSSSTTTYPDPRVAESTFQS